MILTDALPRTPTSKVRKAEFENSLDLSRAWRPPGAPVILSSSAPV